MEDEVLLEILMNYHTIRKRLMKPGHFNMKIYDQIPYSLDRVNYVLSRDDFCKEDFDQIRDMFIEDFFILIQEEKSFDAVSAQDLISKYCDAV